MLYTRTKGLPLLGYQISGSLLLYVCHCIVYVFAHDLPLLFQQCSSIFSNVFFFRILGKIEHLIDKWMFLITKDIQLFINSDFRRIIVFCFKITVMATLTPTERAKRYREKNKENVREREALRKKYEDLRWKYPIKIT